MTDILKVGIAHLGPDRQRGRGLDDVHIRAIDLDPRFAAQGDDRDIAGGGTAIGGGAGSRVEIDRQLVLRWYEIAHLRGLRGIGIADQPVPATSPSSFVAAIGWSSSSSSKMPNKTSALIEPISASNMGLMAFT